MSVISHLKSEFTAEPESEEDKQKKLIKERARQEFFAAIEEEGTSFFPVKKL